MPGLVPLAGFIAPFLKSHEPNLGPSTLERTSRDWRFFQGAGLKAAEAAGVTGVCPQGAGQREAFGDPVCIMEHAVLKTPLGRPRKKAASWEEVLRGRTRKARLTGDS